MDDPYASYPQSHIWRDCCQCHHDVRGYDFRKKRSADERLYIGVVTMVCIPMSTYFIFVCKLAIQNVNKRIDNDTLDSQVRNIFLVLFIFITISCVQFQ